MTLAIELLGRSTVAVDDTPISGDAWRSRRAADVVKLLALAPDPPDPPGAGHGGAVARERARSLRHEPSKALHFARLALGDEQAIVNEHGVLVLAPDARVETDVERFEAAVRNGPWRLRGRRAVP